MSRGHPSTQCFVVPALDGPVTGGTLYNRELCSALGRSATRVLVSELGAAGLGAALEAAGQVWVDSLYLAALPDVAREATGRVGLLAHYLPSFVAYGRAIQPAELGAEEARALSIANAFLVTSDFMREALGPLVAPEKPIFVAVPGSHARLGRLPPNPSLGLRALMIGNVVPGKGLEALLMALSELLRAEDPFELSVVGSLDFDPEYVARCRRVIANSARLAARVTLLGACSPERTAHVLNEAELLLSASRMESFGMALSEARVAGIPIASCAGGNAAAHVRVEAGGQLVDSPRELAAACLELARAPARVQQRIGQARGHALPARPWSETARALLGQLACLEK
ncbi:MAG: glycosyltransferase family 4 protein [Pseudomonadota bacterium]